jgi:hypothetical protein
MDREKMDEAMKGMGQLHIMLCRIPAVGEPLARSLSWCMSVVPWLGGMRRTASIQATHKQLGEKGAEMGFPFELGEPEGDTFVLELPYCPYGFTGAEHARPCDTAMDMDRILMRRLGAELLIDETIPNGYSRCKMRVRQR